MPRRPTVRARGLGAELKELRQNAGLTTRKVGEHAGWSHATVSRIEVGSRGVTTEEVATLLAIYKVTGEARDRLIQLARDAHRPGWWETAEPGLPKQLTALIGFEAEAKRITEMRLSCVPGLLQTADYTRALMQGGGITGQAAETRVVARMGRQAILARPDPPVYRTFIDEAVLRRPLGGPVVMAEQVAQLIRSAAHPNISVQVIPFDKGENPSLDGPFVILEFDKAKTIVHLENKTSGLFLDDSDIVATYMHDVSELESIALSQDETVQFLTVVASNYRDQ